MSTMTNLPVHVASPGYDTSDDCDNLLSLLNPLVVNAVADPIHWRQLSPVIVRWLIGLRDYPWFNHMAIAAVTHSASGVAWPAARLYEMQSFLRWAIPEHFPNLAALEPEPALAAFFGDPPDIRGKGAVGAYHGLQLHTERYLELLPPTKRATLSTFLFPQLRRSRRLTVLTTRAVETTQMSRKKQAFAVIKRLPELVALARRRYHWLAQLERQIQQMIEAFKNGQIQLPVEIVVSGIEDQCELRFGLWDQNSWVMAHPEGYCESTLSRARNRKNGDQFFVQLVGDLPYKPWFLRAIAMGGLQGPHNPTQEARRYLRDWGVRDFFTQEPGLLTTSPGMSRWINLARRHAAGTREDTSMLFRLEPLLSAAAVSLFVVVSIASTGMRLGELQQVSLDRECMEALDLPVFDDKTGKWLQGPKRIYWRLFPKGKNKRERYLVTPYMNEALFILLDLHKRYHNELNLKPVVPSYKQFTHARHFHGSHKFVLQWGGYHISQQSLTRCIKFLLFEHSCRDQDGHPVNITSHVLRHAVAGWLRQRGMPLEEIMVLLKHVNITVTDYYSQRSPDDMYEKLGPALTALADLAGCDPSTIRSHDDVRRVAQEALKQFGALRYVPGGQCGTFDPCMVHFACATCRHFVSDPTRRREVEIKITLCDRIAAMHREAGDYIAADTEHSRKREWERILKEMDALDQVPLMHATVSQDFENVADSDLANLLPVLRETRGLPPGKEVSHAKLQSCTSNDISAFRAHNRVLSERTVALTRQAIARLEAEGQNVTLIAIAQATRTVDVLGKGIAVKTILRNAEARELFHEHSPSYQQRQRQSQLVKRRRSRTAVDAETRSAYRGLRASDLIQLLGESNRQLAQLKAQQSKLQRERDEAYRLRDEALEQNIAQLAALTNLREQSASQSSSTQTKLMTNLGCDLSATRKLL